MLEKSMVTAMRSFWLIQEMQFLNPIRIGSLSQYAGVRLQLSMTNEALEIEMGLFSRRITQTTSHQRRI